MPKIIKPIPITSYWQSTGGEYRLYHGNALDVLRRLPSRSVQCVVTSPPYWGLRDYGTAEWEGGRSDCNHINGQLVSPKSTLRLDGRTHTGPYESEKAVSTGMPYKSLCTKCGAKRIDQQLGSEETPEEYIASMVSIFGEIKRVLRLDGTVWLNLGDSYAGGGRGNYGTGISTHSGTVAKHTNGANYSAGIDSGNLVGIPWRVALALQADGWILRQDIIWAKPNPMPESVENRCTKAHEYIFLLTQTMGYYYDAEAVKSVSTGQNGAASEFYRVSGKGRDGRCIDRKPSGNEAELTGREDSGRSNKRSVWSVDEEARLYQWLAQNQPEVLASFLRDSSNKDDVWWVTTKGYPGAHYATFSGELIRPCIRAGTSEYGACSKCGTAWKRVVSKRATNIRPPTEGQRAAKDREPGGVTGRQGVNGSNTGTNSLRDAYRELETRTLGWQQQCNCKFKEDEEEVRPCIVLDPFIGSGTTLEVCIEEERWGLGIDVSEEYLSHNAIPRVSGNLLCRPGLRHLVGK